MSGQPVIVMDLKEFQHEYIYQLVYFFHYRGYNIWLKNHYRFAGGLLLNNFHIYSLENLKIIQSDNDFVPEECWLLTDFTSGYLNYPFRKKIKINYDLYGTDRRNCPVFQIPMSHDFYHFRKLEKLEQLRLSERSIKIFFSGNVNPDNYNREILHYFWGKLTRIEVLDNIRNNFSSSCISLKDYKLMPDKSEDKILIAEWYWKNDNDQNLSGRIPSDNWLETLAKCDFFLACSGVVMPFSFNLTESMSVGAIPILEYDDLMNPSLVHMKNCIAYKGPADLIDKIKLALSLDDSTIKELRKNVISYYEDHLSPSGFLSKVEAMKEQEFDLFVHGNMISIDKAFRKGINNYI